MDFNVFAKKEVMCSTGTAMESIRPSHFMQETCPSHLIRKIIREAGISVEEFKKILENLYQYFPHTNISTVLIPPIDSLQSPCKGEIFP